MSFLKRITSTVFTVLPGALFFVSATKADPTEYYWGTNLATACALLGAGILFGFLVPPRWHPKWFWIMAAGMLAMLAALFLMVILNATPLCVGQNNGDGNNDLGQCMGMVVLFAIFYGIPYLMMLAVSALAGQGVWNIIAQKESR